MNETHTSNDEKSGEISVTDLLTNKSRRRFLSGLGAVGAAGLAGCTGGENTTSADDESSGSGSSDSRLVANIGQRMGTIDPAKGTDYVQAMALVNLYDPLVFPDSEGTLQPNLASDWSVSEDGTTYTFTLEEGITFHSGSWIAGF